METTMQEKKVSEAFSMQSGIFDEIDKKDVVIQWMRDRVRRYIIENSVPGSMLELNCGTGLDAVFFARKGFEVLATDNAPGMLEAVKKKITESDLKKKVRVQHCSFNELEKIGDEKFDHIFSNFGGLNCAEDLHAVIQKMKVLLKPGGKVTLVIMPRVCPWEMMMLLKGNAKLAFRRFKKNGADSNVEGVNFKTWYYSPRFVKRSFGKDLETEALLGLASVHPPPYLENFPKRFPKFSRFLSAIDERVEAWPFFRSRADHYLISLRKKG
jgi:ubiquinone/menaquinone biosynthesis C-methylase UbiE